MARQDISKQPVPCKLARQRLFSRSPNRDSQPVQTWFARKTGISMESPWIQAHISQCPRCQKRFSAMAKVFLGLNLIKSQPHSLDLLKQANTSTVNVLKQDLRHSVHAQTLKTCLPMPSLKDRFSSISHGIYQYAACIAILVLSKIGVSSSVQSIQRQGQTTVKHLYDKQLGSDLSQDLFSDNA